MDDNGGDNVIDFMEALNPSNTFALEILDLIIEREMEAQEAIEQLLTLVNAICAEFTEFIVPVKSVIEDIGKEI